MASHILKIPTNMNYTLYGAKVPQNLLSELPQGTHIDADSLASLDIQITGKCIGSITPAIQSPQKSPESNDILLSGNQVWPCYTDLHTHLDKTFTWDREKNLVGTFEGAIAAEGRDSMQRWSRADIHHRMNFALRCAYVHGTSAIRTHLVSNQEWRQHTWAAFEELQESWNDRISLQAVSLVIAQEMEGKAGIELADWVKSHSGVLGCALISGTEDSQLIDHIFKLALDRNLDLDFHADENLNTNSDNLRLIAEAALRHKYQGSLVVGHCCSLAAMDDDESLRTIELVREAGICVTSLPQTNLFLQGREPNKTPRWRGITRLKELSKQGVAVALASDNCRDYWNMLGDYDMHEIFSQAILLGQLEQEIGHWPISVNTVPAQQMRLKQSVRIATGETADLIIFEGSTYSELISRPQHNRLIIRQGKPIEDKLPSYTELKN